MSAPPDRPRTVPLLRDLFASVHARLPEVEAAPPPKLFGRDRPPKAKVAVPPGASPDGGVRVPGSPVPEPAPGGPARARPGPVPASAGPASTPCRKGIKI